MRYSNANHKGGILFGRFLKKHTKPGSLLDIGCGKERGVYLDNLTQTIYGVDPELEKETQRFKRRKAENTGFPLNRFDNIVFATSLDHIEDLEAALVEARRILKPDGRVFVWNRVAKKLSGHVRLFTEKELENLFTKLIDKEDHRDITEGMFFCYEL